MRVKIGNYPTQYTPFDLAEIVCFWVKEEQDQYGFSQKPEWVYKFGHWLAYGTTNHLARDDREPTWLYKLMLFIQSKQEQKVDVRIDRWDVYSADTTLACVILPVLQELKKSKDGAPNVDDEDVPEHLRSTNAQPTEDEYDNLDEFFFDRWNWILDEMIFAFDTKVNDIDWDDQFHAGTVDIYFEPVDDNRRMSEMKHGSNHSAVFDSEGYEKYQNRISNGFRLFGKYFESLWDQVIDLQDIFLVDSPSIA